MKPLSTINVIPFIDIMLVLLAVVLTTATFVAQGKIPVNLPGADSADAIEKLQAVELTVSESGALFIDGDGVDEASLGSRLDVLARETPLRIRVDEAAAFQHFVVVIDLLKARQLNNVSIITERQSP